MNRHSNDRGRPLRGLAPGGNLRRWWSAVTAFLLIGVLTEAVFAGALLSGVGWARAAHSLTAVVLIASATTAGIVAAVTLRRIPRGTRLAVALLSLAAVLLVQMAVGWVSANGSNLLWVHVPLGVALLGVTWPAVAGARGLGAH